MSFCKKIEISIIISVIFSLFYSVFTFADTSENIRNEILRLHVIANSDSSEDQELKLKVRDAVLSAGSQIFDGSVDIDNANKKILPEIERLEHVAEKIITENGFNYNVKICLQKEFFTTRTYNYVTLPAGDYLALRVIIGEGGGQNWWCVMFPPMCLSAADEDKVLSSVLNQKEIDLVKKSPQFESRFKIVELIETLKDRIKIK